MRGTDWGQRKMGHNAQNLSTLIVIHFNPLRSFFYNRGLQITAHGPNPAREAIHPACEAIL